MLWNSSTISVTGLRAAGDNSAWAEIARAARFSSVPPTSAARSSPTSNAFRLTMTSFPSATSWRLGHGADRLLVEITGVDEKTIRRGREELAASLVDQPTDRI